MRRPTLSLPLPAALALLTAVASCAERETLSAPAATTQSAVPSPAPPTPPLPVPSAAPLLLAASASPAPAAGALTLVSDSKLVCMVTNQFMGKPQIPVEVSGRTYYGCCEMCKGRLARDAAARTATDPVSNRPVDKSEAVIAQNAKGEISYFENKANLAAYSQRGRP